MSCGCCRNGVEATSQQVSNACGKRSVDGWSGVRRQTDIK
nr:MAG TPA: hypothetical protein [Caudoviricetes sp.]